MVTLKDARPELLGKIAAIEPRLPADQVTDGTGSTTTAQINNLGTWEDSSFVDTHWLVLPNGAGGSGILEVQAVSAFDQADQSGNTIVTVNEPFSTTVVSGVAAYLSNVHPEDVRRSLNIASSVIFPNVYVPRRYHHISGSWAFNGLWDLWSGGVPAFWKKSAAGLTVSELNIPYFGRRGVKLVADSGGPYTFEYMAPYPALHNALVGDSMTFHCFIHAVAASKGGVHITDGGGDGAIVYHAGNSVWAEVETAARTIIQATPTQQISWKIAVASNATVYLGPCWTEGGPGQTDVLIPDVFRRAPTSVGIESNTWPDASLRQEYNPQEGWEMRTAYPAADPDGTIRQSRIVHFPGRLSSSPRLMVFEGEDYLSEGAVETDVYEVEAQHEELFYTLAIVNLKETLGEYLGSGSEEFQTRMARNWMQIYRGILKQPGQRMPRKALALRPAVSSGPALFGAYTGPGDR